jgi:cell division protein FtsQ
MRRLKEEPSGEGGQSGSSASIHYPSNRANKGSRAPKKTSRYSFFLSTALWDRFSFARIKEKQNSSERIRAKRGRSQVRSWITLISIISIIIFLAVSIFLGLPHKAYHTAKTRLIDFSGTIGLDVRDVFVEGRKHTKLDMILAATQVKTKTPILAYDIDVILENLLKLDWIKSVTVQRRLPNLIYIRLVEREPIALWQHQKNHYLVDKDGVVIKGPILENFKNLPIVVGTDAPVHAPKLITLLEQFPLITKHLTAMVRIRERRWDLLLDGTITVKLPEENQEEALSRLTILLDEHKITPTDVLAIDLRLPKQVIMKLTPEAAVRVKVRGKEKV